MNKESLALQARKTSSIVVVWRLDAIMRKYKITNTQLASVLTKTPAAICKIKQSPVMPRVNSSYISDLLIALNYLRMKQIEINQLNLFSLKEFSVPIVFYDLIKVESSDKN